MVSVSGSCLKISRALSPWEGCFELFLKDRIEAEGFLRFDRVFKKPSHNHHVAGAASADGIAFSTDKKPVFRRSGGAGDKMSGSIVNQKIQRELGSSLQNRVSRFAKEFFVHAERVAIPEIAAKPGTAEREEGV